MNGMAWVNLFFSFIIILIFQVCILGLFFLFPQVNNTMRRGSLERRSKHNPSTVPGRNVFVVESIRDSIEASNHKKPTSPPPLKVAFSTDLLER